MMILTGALAVVGFVTVYKKVLEKSMDVGEKFGRKIVEKKKQMNK